MKSGWISLVRLTRAWTYLGSAVRFFIFITLLVPRTMQGESTGRQCFLEVAVYDAQGNRLEFNITGVYVREGDSVTDILHHPINQGRLRIDRNRLYHQNITLPSRRFEMKLSGGSRREFRRDFVLETCQSRLSANYDEADNGQDAGPSFIDGRLSGCSFAGDWWIRAVPMFDDLEPTEAYVDPKNGTFSVAAYRGFRYLVVAGKGKDALKVISANVTRGGVTTHLGVVDMAGACAAK